MQLWKRSTQPSFKVGLMAVGVLLLGILLLSPASMLTFFNIPGLLVVVGGTFAATFVSRPMADVKRVLLAIPELFREQKDPTPAEVGQLLRFSAHYRLGKLRAAEREVQRIDNPFLQSGLHQVLEGCSAHDISKMLQWRLSGVRSREYGQAQILRTMAGFAPAFGMLGTLFGLVHMLAGIGERDMGETGTIMAFAMITTFYGIVAANLFFKPLAIKMERRTQQRLIRMSMLMEGILMAHDRRHPTHIHETLQAIESHQGISEVQKPLTLVTA